jgi:hypothetical protein
MIEIKHNEHSIRYDESSDLWECRSLEMEEKTLSALKTKINEFDAIERRLGDGVSLFLLEGAHGYLGLANDIKVRATMLGKEIGFGNIDGVWVSHIGSKKREKVYLKNLIYDTPRNVMDLRIADDLRKKADELYKESKNMLERIERVTVDGIKKLALETKPA